ncbi:uncharacterized protein LOC142970715 isoform X5 [Anarhichas minor]|uniref:uncharacterized protein LOC142970715 isoform X5 n=1 Tax=Anarhichas minor TaxID=65739 RepID=UPI003F74105C
MRTLLLTSALMAGLLGSLSAIPVPVPVPYHAFCGSLWLFGLPCAEIGSRLVEQIEAFSLQRGCAECQYTLVSATPLNIRANHTSAGGLQTENITLTLSPISMTSGCRVSGQSVSVSFTSCLDDGLNYCNLRNLLTGCGLNYVPGLMELTNEWTCLGYSLSTCKA